MHGLKAAMSILEKNIYKIWNRLVKEDFFGFKVLVIHIFQCRFTFIREGCIIKTNSVIIDGQNMFNIIIRKKSILLKGDPINILHKIVWKWGWA